MNSTTHKEFRCKHCNGNIVIPINLPPTTGPCPHCGVVITSPGNETPVAPAISVQIPTPPIAALPTVSPPVAVPLQAVSITPPPSPVILQESPKESPAPPAGVEETPPTKAELPPRNESRKNRKEEKPPLETLGEKPQSSGLIPAMIVLFILFLAGVGVVFYVKEKGAMVQPHALKPATIDTVARELAYIKSGWKKDAYQLLSDYIAATDSKGKLPFVLNPSTLATKIDDFYGGGVIVDSDTPAEAFSVYELSVEDRKRGLFMMVYDQPPQFDMKEFFRPLASLEVQYGVDEADLLLSTLARVGNFAMEPLRVHAFFKRTPEGLKLDWEIFAQTKYRTFQNFTELPEVGQTATFRVFIVEDVPDKGKAVTGTRTYRMADPANTSDSARANVKIDSEIGRALSIINWRGPEQTKPITRTATIELTWVGEEAAPELEISRFICWEFLGLGGQETPATASMK